METKLWVFGWLRAMARDAILAGIDDATEMLDEDDINYRADLLRLTMYRDEDTSKKTDKPKKTGAKPRKRLSEASKAKV